METGKDYNPYKHEYVISVRLDERDMLRYRYDKHPEPHKDHILLLITEENERLNARIRDLREELRQCKLSVVPTVLIPLDPTPVSDKPFLLPVGNRYKLWAWIKRILFL